MTILADDISHKFPPFHAFENKNWLGGPKEMKVSAFESGDLDAYLEKRMKSFEYVFVDFWSCEVK